MCGLYLSKNNQLHMWNYIERVKISETSKNNASQMERWVKKQPMKRDHVAYRRDSWKGK